MIAGYISYEEIKLITGFTDFQLRQILIDGIRHSALQVLGKRGKLASCYKEYLYDLQEVEEWIRTFIY